MKCDNRVFKQRKLQTLFLSLFLLLTSCDAIEEQQTANVSGVWSGNYTWACSNTNSGSSPLVLTLTQEDNKISGTAAYLSGISSLSGTVNGSLVVLEITGTSVITPNWFEGTRSDSSFNGTTINGENCSAPSGKSGSFALTKQTPETTAPTRLALLGPDYVTLAKCSPAFTIEARNDSNTPAALVSSVTLSLTGGGSGVFYTDKNCSLPVNSVTITGGGTSQNFFFKDAVAEDLTLAADDPAGGLSGATMSVSVIGQGGSVTFDLDGAAANHSTNAHAHVESGSVDLWGYDASGNFFGLFVPAYVGTYTCNSGVSMYYQTAGGSQWGGYSDFGVCSVTITSIGKLGQPVSGVFSGDLAAQFGGAAGTRAITNGQFAIIQGLP